MTDTEKDSTDLNKSTDKQEIESEEREKMLNAENKSLDEKLRTGNKDSKDDKQSVEEIKVAPGDVPKVTLVDEGREVKPKKIPIGGIKMPGFFTRSKSKDKCKEADTDGADGELLEAPCVDATCTEKAMKDKEANEGVKKTNRLSLKLTNPFAKRPKSGTEEEPKTPEEDNKEESQPPKKGLLNAIRLPLANIIPRKLKPAGSRDAAKEVEEGLGPAGRAGLASMETLDESKDDTPAAEVVTKDEHVVDGMETVKLEVEEKKDDAIKQEEQTTLMERIRGYKCIIGGVLAFLVLLIIILSVALSGSPAALRTPPVRDGKYVQAVTSCGLVEGMMEDGAFAFRGIPYADPPIESNRWRVAKPLDSISACWNGTFLAHNATPTCLQTYANGSIDGVEDCLTLDVVTPYVRYDTPLPVVVLIGTESLTGGTPSKMRPSARYARSKDVVFVRPNFRVGVLGFLSLEVLSQSTHPPTSGNYALSDILAALKWVQLNIKHFGGDPDAVTLFGHRAGATLVTLLTSSRKSKGLFARTWVTSGAAIYPGKALIESERRNEHYLEQMRCKDAACLRKADAEDLLFAVPDTWRRISPDLPAPSEESDKRHEWLVLDGDILQQHPADVWSKEASVPVKMVIGTTAHESFSTKLFFKHKEWTPELVIQHVKESKLGALGLAEEALKLYNATFQGLVAMISDIRTVCPLLTVATLQLSVPFYVVTQTRGENDIADVDVDVSAILGRYEPKTPEQRRYVSAIQQLFYHYVSNGEVNQAEETIGRVLDVGQDVLPVTTYPNCDFWINNDVVPRYGRLD